MSSWEQLTHEWAGVYGRMIALACQLVDGDRLTLDEAAAVVRGERQKVAGPDAAELRTLRARANEALSRAFAADVPRILLVRRGKQVKVAVEREWCTHIPYVVVEPS